MSISLREAWCKVSDWCESPPWLSKALVTGYCLPVGWVNVAADGTVVSECGGADATRTGLGTYALTPPAGALTMAPHVVETADRDSIEIHGSDYIGSVIQIHEGDNGGTPGIFQDRAFSVVWFGAAASIVTGVQ